MKDLIISFNQRVLKLTTDVVVGPMKTLLGDMPKIDAWTASRVGESLSADLPSFGVTQQNYVTKVNPIFFTRNLSRDLHSDIEQGKRIGF